MNLQLPLKKQWFTLTKAGIKTEDYREINLYWFKRLVFNSKKAIEYLNIKTDADVKIICNDAFWKKSFAFKPFYANTMTLGYPKKNDSQKILYLRHKGIEIREGKPEWGAEPGKLYFVVCHGNSLTQNQINRKTTVNKYEGKILYDKTVKETFVFDNQKDWFILFSDPERFEIKC